MSKLTKLRDTANETDKQATEASVAWKRAAAKMTPEEWVEELKRIKNKKLQPFVANIIWWDYFAVKQANDEDNALIPFLEKYRPDMEVNNLDIRKALRVVGYPNQAAVTRTRNVAIALGKESE